MIGSDHRTSTTVIPVSGRINRERYTAANDRQARSNGLVLRPVATERTIVRATGNLVAIWRNLLIVACGPVNHVHKPGPTTARV